MSMCNSGTADRYWRKTNERNLIVNLLYRAIQAKQNSNCFLPFNSASVDKLLDDVKGAAEVTPKD